MTCICVRGYHRELSLVEYVCHNNAFASCTAPQPRVRRGFAKPLQLLHGGVASLANHFDDVVEVVRQVVHLAGRGHARTHGSCMQSFRDVSMCT